MGVRRHLTAFSAAPNRYAARMPPRGPTREALAVAAATVVHLALLLYVTQAQPRVHVRPRPQASVAMQLVRAVPPATSAALPVADRPPPQVRAPTTPIVAEPVVQPPTAPLVADVSAQHAADPSPAPAGVAPTASAPSGTSLLRVRPDDGAIGRVLGTGGVLGPSTALLEGALDERAQGPLSDHARAEQRIKEAILADLADDEVTSGMTDDYFRTLKDHVITQWRPAMKDLNDGGERVTQVGMMRDVFQEREAWGEMYQAYSDLAKQYATGSAPTLQPARRERLKELMRSRKGAFRFHAIIELVLTQGPDGRVLTIDATLPSGHLGIDEGVKDAISRGVQAMPDPPPLRVHGGQSFTSTWRFRATWMMVPPTAFFTGTSFDITPKGFQIDVPFDIQLKTNVLLMRTRTHGKEAQNANTTGDPE